MRPGAKNLIGFQIRLFRERRGWTQRRLAECFRKEGILVTRDMISSIETQRCAVTDYQIVFFARVLGVSWKSLFPTRNGSRRRLWGTTARRCIALTRKKRR
jgi:transcriptional regulator with XRE-family HTH domain